MMNDKTINNTPNPYIALTEEEIISKLEVSRAHANEGCVRNADDVIKDTRDKFDLHEVY